MKEETIHTIIITDDHPMVASGFRAIINEQLNLRVIFTTNSAKELLQLLEKETADLLILDISMPDMDGVEAAKIIRTKYPKQKVLCISTFYQPSLYPLLQAIPVQGFVPKLSDTKIIIESIYKVLNNEPCFVIRTDENKETNKLILTEITNKLGRREIEIMKLIKDGKTTKQISDELCIAVTTVETHRKNIAKKLEITETNGLYKFALQNF